MGQIQILHEIAASAIPQELVRGRNILLLKVKDNSFTDEEIAYGDLILVEAQSTPKDEETVLASVGGKATVKKFYREDEGRVRLQSGNEKVKPIIAKVDEVEIRGLVVAVIRKYE